MLLPDVQSRKIAGDMIVNFKAQRRDGLLPLLLIGERLHPEFDEMFLANPDKSIQLTVSGQSLKTAWQEINEKLYNGF